MFKRKPKVKEIGTPFDAVHAVHVDKELQWKSGAGTGTITSTAFNLSDLIGEGSFGAVYRANQKGSAFDLAIKIIDTGEETEDENLMKELDILKKCSHPNIVSFYGSIWRQRELWILMDYCSMGSVRDLIETNDETLNEKQIAYITNETLNGLKYLHNLNIIHRDVKAANILLTEKGEVKLADFGVSEPLITSLFAGDTIVGTPLYIAPEGIRMKQYGPKTDIWALGITIIELADGFPPYSEMNPMRAMFMIPSKPSPSVSDPKKWSREMILFLERCLNKSVADRADALQLTTHPFVTASKGKEVMKSSIEKAISNRKKQQSVASSAKKRLSEFASKLKSDNKTNQEDSGTAVVYDTSIVKDTAQNLSGTAVVYSSVIVKEETGAYSTVLIKPDGTIVSKTKTLVVKTLQDMETQTEPLKMQTNFWNDIRFWIGVGAIIVLMIAVYAYQLTFVPVVVAPKKAECVFF